jgi:hypothetical protein
MAEPTMQTGCIISGGSPRYLSQATAANSNFAPSARVDDDDGIAYIRKTAHAPIPIIDDEGNGTVIVGRGGTIGLDPPIVYVNERVHRRRAWMA